MVTVAGHMGIRLNERADELAKEELYLDSIEVDINYNNGIVYCPYWNGFPIEYPIRKFIKELNNDLTQQHWSLNRSNIDKLIGSQIDQDYTNCWSSINVNKNQHCKNWQAH